MPELKITARSRGVAASQTKTRRNRLMRATREVSKEVPAAIAAWIRQRQPFKPREGEGGVADSFRAWPDAGRIHVMSTVPYAYWLNYGIKPHQMTYLLERPLRTYLAFGRYPYQARAPIPIRTPTGTVFRRPTEEAMARGRWMHPGRPATHFLEQAMDALIAQVKTEHPELRFHVEIS